MEEQNILYAPHRVYLHFIFHIAVDEASFRGVETGDAKYGMNHLFSFSFSHVRGGGMSEQCGSMLIYMMTLINIHHSMFASFSGLPLLSIS